MPPSRFESDQRRKLLGYTVPEYECGANRTEARQEAAGDVRLHVLDFRPRSEARTEWAPMFHTGLHQSDTLSEPPDHHER